MNKYQNQSGGCWECGVSSHVLATRHIRISPLTPDKYTGFRTFRWCRVPPLPKDPCSRVTRGAAWRSNGEYPVRAAQLNTEESSDGHRFLGFRTFRSGRNPIQVKQ